MKRDFIYLVIIAILLIIIIQSKFLPQEIGRYTYFRDGDYPGFLDTKEGFIYVSTEKEWIALDLKEILMAKFSLELLREKSGGKSLDSLNLSPEDRRNFLDSIKKELKPVRKRIWK